MLAAQSRRLGLVSTEFPVVRDEVAATRLAIQVGLQEVDVLILTGGVSMGRHDYVPQVLKEEGVEIIFHKVAIKPGKPVLFGRLDKQLIFGLPGNPVSSFVTFELFVRPAIRRWMGLENAFLPEVRACIEVPFRNRSGRTFYAPGLAESTGDRVVVSPITTKGSADLVAFARANCLVVLPASCGEIEAGKSVKILLLADLIQRGTWNET
jgi:molybdopterin molybdotransferase